MAPQEEVQGYPTDIPVPACQPGMGHLPQGRAVPRATCLALREKKWCPPYLAAELGHKAKNTFTPSETRDISRALCFQFKVQIKGGGYFRKQMAMIRALSLR